MNSQLSLQPALRRGVRMQWEKIQNCHVLLYPEGMVKLNETSAAILQLCDGQHTFLQITTILQEQYQATDLAKDIDQFLQLAFQQQWIQ